MAPDVKVLMLLDRQADIHLAKRSAADAWLVKPYDPLTLQRAVRDVLAGPAGEDALGSAEAVEEEAPAAG
jgi:DNA-binding response OmpR family regulator